MAMSLTEPGDSNLLVYSDKKEAVGELFRAAGM